MSQHQRKPVWNDIRTQSIDRLNNQYTAPVTQKNSNTHTQSSHLKVDSPPLNFIVTCRFRFIVLFCALSNNQGHIATDSLWVEDSMHTTWSRFCIVSHQASVSNYQLSNMKCPCGDSNQRPQTLRASTSTPPNPRIIPYKFSTQISLIPLFSSIPSLYFSFQT